MITTTPTPLRVRTTTRRGAGVGRDWGWPGTEESCRLTLMRPFRLPDAHLPTEGLLELPADVSPAGFGEQLRPDREHHLADRGVLAHDVVSRRDLRQRQRRVDHRAQAAVGEAWKPP